MDWLVEKCHAKINVFLHIVGRRPDRYSLLESLINFVDLHDVIRVRPSSKRDSLKFIGVYSYGINAENNTVSKLMCLLRGYRIIDGYWEIEVTKNIPQGSGIGGSAVDVAGLIRIMKKRYPDICSDIWDEIAIGVGADVPVCTLQRSAFVSGIGEHVVPLDENVGKYVLLVIDTKCSSTKLVFDGYDGNFCTPSLHDMTLIKTATKNAYNSLFRSAAELNPNIRVILDAMKEVSGCYLQGMSGSGSAVFGIFNDKDLMNNAALSMKEKFNNCFIHAGYTI